MPISSLPLSRCWPGLLLAILLAGCTSVDKRIAENRTVFADLSPEAQHDIRNGQVSLGFTPAMVYMALGKPAQINTSADAKEVRWTYIYFNTPDGGVAQWPKAYVGKMRTVESLFQATPRPMMPGNASSNAVGTVAGVDDLMNGRVRPPDPRIRDATMRDVMEGPRQDLVIRFTEGVVTGFELVHET